MSPKFTELKSERKFKGRTYPSIIFDYPFAEKLVLGQFALISYPHFIKFIIYKYTHDQEKRGITYALIDKDLNIFPTYELKQINNKPQNRKGKIYVK